MVLKRTTLKKFLLLLMFYMPFLRFFTANFGILYPLTKLACPLLIILVVFGLYFNKYKKKKRNYGKLTNWLKLVILLQVSFALISFLVNLYPVGQFFYGLYYHLRLPVFCILLIIFFELTDVNRVNRFVIKVVYADAVFMTYQFLFMGLRQDFLGGLFGNTQGCNGIQNVICCLGLAITLSKYLYRKKSLRSFLCYIFVTCYMAAIAELTIYFAEVILALLVSFVVGKKRRISMRKAIMLFVGGITVIAGFALLIWYFPTKARFLSVEEILKYLGAEDSGVYTVSRIHGISQIRKAYMDDGLLAFLGLGLGRTLEGTPFYTMYGGINYTWFSSTLLMMESGYVGVAIKLFVLVAFGIKAFKNFKETEKDKKNLHLMCLLMAIFSILWFFYNNTLDDKYCVYIIAYALSISSIIKKEEGKLAK